MAERRPDPPEPRASLVDSGWSEPAPAPERELPAYEDTARDHLVTRVDDQIQARIAAMNVEERTEVTSSPLSAPPPTTRTSPRSSPRAAAQAPNAPAVAPSAAAVLPAAPAQPLLEEVTSSVILPSSVKATSAAPMAPSTAVKSPLASASGPRPAVQVTRSPSQVPRPPVPPPPRRPSVAPPAALPLPAAPPPSSPVAARQAPLPDLVAAPVEERTLVDREPPGGESLPVDVVTAPPKPPSLPPARHPSIPPPKPSSLPPPPPFAPLHAPAGVAPFVPPPAIGAALRDEVRVFGAEMPLWGVVGPLVVVTGLVCAFVGGWLGSVPKPAAEPAAARSAVVPPSSAVPAATLGPTSEKAAAAAPRSGSLVERARAGEDRAVAVLEHQRPEQRTAEEAVALSAGKSAQSIAAVAKLRARLAADPGLAKDPKVIADLRRYAQDAETSRDALAAMAALPGALSADLLYDVWTSTPDRSQTTELAQALLTSRDVRPKASPALAVALDLREAETCEANARILPRAIEVGDKRAFAPLARLLRRTGCGPSKHDDCFACIREGDALKNALNATKIRREPELVRREGVLR